MVQTELHTSLRKMWLLQTRLGSAGASAAGQASTKLTLRKSRSPLRIQVARRERVSAGFVKMGLKSLEPLRERDWLWLRVPRSPLESWLHVNSGSLVRHGMLEKASRMQSEEDMRFRLSI